MGDLFALSNPIVDFDYIYILGWINRRQFGIYRTQLSADISTPLGMSHGSLSGDPLDQLLVLKSHIFRGVESHPYSLQHAKQA